MKNLYKLLFYSTLLSSTMIVMASPSWMAMWMGLEINLLSFIPLMKDKTNPISFESLTKYFIIQAAASTIFLLALIIDKINIEPQMLIALSMMMKLGMAPFHFWYPPTMEGLSWMNCFILSTWQKMGPSITSSYLTKMINMLIGSIIITNFISSMFSINTTSIRKIMAYSSMNNLSWMLPLVLISKPSFLMFFLIYSLINLSILLLLNSLKAYSISQLIFKKTDLKSNLLINLSFLSLAGLPPFLGFLPKWISIQALTSENLIFMLMLLIVSSTLFIFTYSRLMISSILLINKEMAWNNLSFSPNTPLINFLSLLFLLPWMILSI